MWNTDHTLEPEDGYKSEQAMASEKERNNKGLDDAGDGELAENTWEEEADKVELSEIEVAEEETATNDSNNNLPAHPQLQKKCSISKNKLKKQKKSARKARAKAATKLRAQEGDEDEDEALTLRDCLCKMVTELPYQVYLLP